MNERTKPLRVAIDAEGGPLARFLMRSLETSDGINGLLALFDGPEEEVARRLAPYYLNGIVRLHGSGKWVREENGTWKLEQFDISEFEVLDDSPMTEVVGKLRAVEGSTWHESEDALSHILGLRRDDRDRH